MKPFTRAETIPNPNPNLWFQCNLLLIRIEPFQCNLLLIRRRIEPSQCKLKQCRKNRIPNPIYGSVKIATSYKLIYNPLVDYIRSYVHLCAILLYSKASNLCYLLTVGWYTVACKPNLYVYVYALMMESK